MLKQKYFLTGIFILSAERQPIKLAWRKIVWLRIKLCLCLKTESRYKKKPTTESCFHLHKILDSFAERKFNIISGLIFINLIPKQNRLTTIKNYLIIFFANFSILINSYNSYINNPEHIIHNK